MCARALVCACSRVCACVHACLLRQILFPPAVVELLQRVAQVDSTKLPKWQLYPELIEAITEKMLDDNPEMSPRARKRHDKMVEDEMRRLPTTCTSACCACAALGRTW